MTSRLPFGLKEGKLVHISEVENGLKCECICPSCQGVLLAKKGSLKVHHFAHFNTEECRYGLETALHIAAKEILKRRKRIKIPSVVLPIGARGREFHQSGYIKFNDVKLERKLHEIIPDILVNVNGTLLIIEIKVTHGVDKLKLEKIKSLNISTIEIDLSNNNRIFKYNELEKIILDETNNKKWLFNRKVEEETAKIINNCDEIRVYGKRKFIVSCPFYAKQINYNVSCKKCIYNINYDKEEKIVLCGKRSATTKL